MKSISTCGSLLSAMTIGAMAVAGTNVATQGGHVSPTKKVDEARRASLAASLPQTVIFKVSKKDTTNVQVARLPQELSAHSKVPAAATFEKLAMDSEVTGIPFATKELDAASSTSSSFWRSGYGGYRAGYSGYAGYSYNRGRSYYGGGRGYYGGSGYGRGYNYNYGYGSSVYYPNNYYGNYLWAYPQYVYSGYSYDYVPYGGYEDDDCYYVYSRWNHRPYSYGYGYGAY